MTFADLHLHSNFSDGLLSPAELAQVCAEKNLKTCCLTDHDTIAGYTQFSVACAALGINTFPGIELSTSLNGVSFHVLGYKFDPANEKFTSHLAQTEKNRTDRIHAILERLRQQGFDITIADLESRTEGAQYGRPQIADAMIAKGYAKDFNEAFNGYLGISGPAHVKYEKISTLDAIELIKAAGGLAVIAHPGLQNRDDVLPALIEAGLDGIEIIHPEHNEALVVLYEQMATSNNLFVTGGSDYHARPQDLDHLGTFKIAESRLTQLLAGHRD